jgi:hypothetical protein
MKTKIQNKKILYQGGRLLCNASKITIEELQTMIQNYLFLISKIKEVPGLSIDQEKLNFGIRFKLFKIDCTVGKLFELYNEIAVLNNLKVYSKLWYNPAKAVKICPTEINKQHVDS